MHSERDKNSARSTVVEKKEPTKFEASPISSLSRPQTRRHGETRILFTIHTLHARIFSILILCSSRLTVVCGPESDGFASIGRNNARVATSVRYVPPRIKIPRDFRPYFILPSIFIYPSIFPVENLRMNGKRSRTEVSLIIFFSPRRRSYPRKSKSKNLVEERSWTTRRKKRKNHLLDLSLFPEIIIFRVVF